MALSLLLSACSKDFKFVRRGVIEKIEGNSIICNGMGNSLTDEVDCLFDETLAVGDTVNIYSDGDVLVASKADYANAQFILNNYGMSWVVREMPFLIPYCILLAFLIYSYDIYVQNLFPLKGTGGKVLRGILVGGFLLFLNVLPRFTADLWSSETLEILRVPNLIYLPLILAAWLVSRWGYLRFSQYVERINL